MKLDELEKRLRDEPDNLGLRVKVAGALREAGRADDAIELYRSVAVAYRDQGRTVQAIAVCRSILEIAPDDARCHALLNTLKVRGETGPQIAIPTPIPTPPKAMPAATPPPERQSALDQTPLPTALPYHVADPTTHSLQRISDRFSDSDLPAVEGADTRPGKEAPSEPAAVTGLASAARRISARLIGEDLADELDTRQRPKIESSEIRKIALPPDEELDGEPATRDTTRDALDAIRKEIDTEEDTRPRDLPVGTRTSHTPDGLPLVLSPFFRPLPDDRRDDVLTRFFRRTIAKGTTVIRQGETGHSFILVARGRLEIRAERAGGLVTLATLAAGDFVGEGALLARTPAPAHVVAISEAELLLLPPPDFYELARSYPALAAALEASAARRKF